jgi:hypothetical protein
LNQKNSVINILKHNYPYVNQVASQSSNQPILLSQGNHLGQTISSHIEHEGGKRVTLPDTFTTSEVGTNVIIGFQTQGAFWDHLFFI